MHAYQLYQGLILLTAFHSHFGMAWHVLRAVLQSRWILVSCLSDRKSRFLTETRTPSPPELAHCSNAGRCNLVVSWSSFIHENSDLICYARCRQARERRRLYGTNANMLPSSALYKDSLYTIPSTPCQSPREPRLRFAGCLVCSMLSQLIQRAPSHTSCLELPLALSS